MSDKDSIPPPMSCHVNTVHWMKLKDVGIKDHECDFTVVVCSHRPQLHTFSSPILHLIGQLYITFLCLEKSIDKLVSSMWYCTISWSNVISMNICI